jgi:hypothetical protein
MGKEKYSPEVYSEICRRYSAGETLASLGIAFGFDLSSIPYILDRYGIKRRTQSESSKDRSVFKRRIFNWEKAKKFYENGMTCREICEVLNVKDISTIYHALIKQGVLIRHNKTTGKIGKYTSRWNGGISYDFKGHRRLYLPQHPSANKGGLIYEHRYIMEQHLGRRLHRWEVVHHINGIPDDNKINNLQLMTAREHNKLHNNKER